MIDAANDAHSALMAYRRMMRIAAIHELTPDSREFASNVLRDSPVSEPLDNEPAAKPPPLKLPSETQASSSSASTPVAAVAPPISTPQASARSPVATVSNRSPSRINPDRPILQHTQAYRLWHLREIPLDDMCAMLRSKENPLQRGTVM